MKGQHSQRRAIISFVVFVLVVECIVHMKYLEKSEAIPKALYSNVNSITETIYNDIHVHHCSCSTYT